MFDPHSYFNLSDFPCADIFSGPDKVWNALVRLKEYMAANAAQLDSDPSVVDGVPLTEPFVYWDGMLQPATDCTIVYGATTKGGLEVYRAGDKLSGASVIMAGVTLIGEKIKIGRGVLIESGALVKEPAIFGDNTEVRQGAYLRGNCLVGKRCIVGHATEVKHSIFLNDAKAGHFAYVGDSILGGEANLGAGTKMANLRFLPGNVTVRTQKGMVDSGLRKFGAILGDRVQTGCNSVTNPGTVIGPDSILMPNTTAPSGYHLPSSVIR